jgi:hypothetical protein
MRKTASISQRRIVLSAMTIKPELSSQLLISGRGTPPEGPRFKSRVPGGLLNSASSVIRENAAMNKLATQFSVTLGFLRKV